MNSKPLIHSVALTAIFASLAGNAIAAPAIALTGDKTLVWFDTEKPEVTKSVDVEGVDMLQGIDVRPSNGMLYGVTKDGTIVTIDAATGAATAGKKLATNLPDGVSASIDFNPVADRMRLMGSDGTNLRANVDTGEVTTDGKLVYEQGDAGAANAPKIVATAYLNSFGKPEATKMYDLDASGSFIQQTKPNDGLLKTVGASGIPQSDSLAMDIQTTADGTNTIWVAAGSALYTVTAETGVATKKADITGLKGTLRDIAILPAK
jgi:Domain of unknown function (DUF4394)